jgi:hypothetical protein
MHAIASDADILSLLMRMRSADYDVAAAADADDATVTNNQYPC